ncbi:stress-responsive transcriptional activator MSN2 NDAI_0B01340 [Naumovozyma dairenensis CBS 421]|uniref:C2H2-type domain-containing protein n=1 Tax=Naumovozyma dairenensis (strain ATCC 10597 / BCRC 20456 / CBS 421 / NBRC 0211 / NRRL Y-12639) TaxID=1071378 RepID=G0W5V7_NAUDC|nr:hypothetical protein NDAI_0B01340 [Naumovozyma dairenensis CBS 421]CCD23168.1 hypothetical protein NDAI_0B01340 [Naumovozyma dairenensis CBS 421]
MVENRNGAVSSASEPTQLNSDPTTTISFDDLNIPNNGQKGDDNNINEFINNLDNQMTREPTGPNGKSNTSRSKKIPIISDNSMTDFLVNLESPYISSNPSNNNLESTTNSNDLSPNDFAFPLDRDVESFSPFMNLPNRNISGRFEGTTSNNFLDSKVDNTNKNTKNMRSIKNPSPTEYFDLSQFDNLIDNYITPDFVKEEPHLDTGKNYDDDPVHRSWMLKISEDEADQFSTFDFNRRHSTVITNRFPYLNNNDMNGRNSISGSVDFWNLPNSRINRSIPNVNASLRPFTSPTTSPPSNNNNNNNNNNNLNNRSSISDDPYQHSKAVDAKLAQSLNEFNMNFGSVNTTTNSETTPSAANISGTNHYDFTPHHQQPSYLEHYNQVLQHSKQPFPSGRRYSVTKQQRSSLPTSESVLNSELFTRLYDNSNMPLNLNILDWNNNNNNSNHNNNPSNDNNNEINEKNKGNEDLPTNTSNRDPKIENVSAGINFSNADGSKDPLSPNKKFIKPSMIFNENLQNLNPSLQSNLLNKENNLEISSNSFQNKEPINNNEKNNNINNNNNSNGNNPLLSTVNYNSYFISNPPIANVQPYFTESPVSSTILRPKTTSAAGRRASSIETTLIANSHQRLSRVVSPTAQGNQQVQIQSQRPSSQMPPPNQLPFTDVGFTSLQHLTGAFLQEHGQHQNQNGQGQGQDRGIKTTTAYNYGDENKPFQCDQCTKSFRRSEHLKRHVRSVHSKERPFACNLCEKKFSRSDNLSQHLKTHKKHGDL